MVINVTPKIFKPEVFPSHSINDFVTEYNSILSGSPVELSDKNSEKNFPNNIPWRYVDIHQFNQIDPVIVLHVQIYCLLILLLLVSIFMTNFHIIGISEHKVTVMGIPF